MEKGLVQRLLDIGLYIQNLVMFNSKHFKQMNTHCKKKKYCWL